LQTPKRSAPARRSSRPSGPPSAGLAPQHWRGTLFAAADVVDLSEIVKLPLQVAAEGIAIHLNTAFAGAQFQADTHEVSPPPAVLKKWLADVSNDAKVLLGRLDMPAEPARYTGKLEANPHLMVWYRHLCQGLPLLEPEDDRTLVLSGEAWDWLHPAPGLTRAETLLALVSCSVALLAAVAAHVAREIKVGVGTNRPDYFRKTLFRDLVRIHLIAYGRFPETRVGDERGGKGVGWAKEAIRRAARKWSEVAPGKGLACYQLLLDLDQAEPSTVSKRLEDAARSLKRKT